MGFETITWDKGRVIMLDQKKLPGEVKYHAYGAAEDVAVAIETMIIRGAPAIGVAAAYGLALASQEISKFPIEEAKRLFRQWCARFSKTRPTAVNLFWGIQRMQRISDSFVGGSEAWSHRLVEEAQTIREEDIAACKKLGAFGARLMPEKGNVLTHCNAGALATGGWGTALGVIRSAVSEGKNLHVYADETRPFLQGSRLTAWELKQDQIPVTLITDNMAGHFMALGEISAVIVGADRIAANGDTANKIGTYPLAVLARHHDIPFFVAAPYSTVDFECPNGKAIPIEERSADEVFEFAGQQVAPDGIRARHPAFDVTPARYISAIITEKGICEPPFEVSLPKLYSPKHPA